MTPDVERTGERPAERPVEQRLRRALDARAAGVTVRELRPADPPGPHVRRLPFPLARLRGFTLPLAGLAAAAAALVGYLVLAPDASPVRPVPPASPPEITNPGPRPSSLPATPSPSVSPTPIPTPSPSKPEVASSTTPSRPPSAASPSRAPSALPGALPSASGPVPSSSPGGKPAGS